MSRRLFRRLYDRAKSADDLPWHRAEPPALLVEAVAARQTPPGRALDIGCGSGVFSVWLAERGYDVTAIDFTPAALEMARDRAQKAGADITFHEVDVTTPWEAPAPFDVVVDSGCLHCFGAPAPRAAYRANVLSWLAPNGDYLLGHFLKRHALDWRPIGPHRFRPERINRALRTRPRAAAAAPGDGPAPTPAHRAEDHGRGVLVPAYGIGQISLERRRPFVRVRDRGERPWHLAVCHEGRNLCSLVAQQLKEHYRNA